MIDWGSIIEKVLLAVISVALPLLLKWLFDWLKLKRAEFEQNVGEQWVYALDEAVRLAVRAAEQSGLAKLITDTAEAKKRYAIDRAESYLHERGFDIDLDVLEAAIEAEVIRQFPKPAPVQPLPSDVGL
jgi:hypothetical protein